MYRGVILREMAIFKTGNLFGVPKEEHIIVTTNSFIRKDVALAMGRGAAKDLVDYLPGIDIVFGKIILDTCGHLGEYHLIMSGRYGAFQTKRHFKYGSDISLIRRAVSKLRTLAEVNPKSIYNLNFPGIGYGGLRRNQVLPLLETLLPDTVTVWEFSTSNEMTF